jgi:hypothetical protein
VGHPRLFARRLAREVGKVDPRRLADVLETVQRESRRENIRLTLASDSPSARARAT